MGTKFTMSDQSKEYYKDSVDLVRADISDKARFDEVIILTAEDFVRGLKKPTDQNPTGLDVLHNNENMRLFNQHHPQFFSVFSSILQSQIVDARYSDHRSLSDAAVPIKLDVPGEATPRKIGVVFLSTGDSFVSTFVAGAAGGYSDKEKSALMSRAKNSVDDFKKFIIFPHEIGHLVDADKENLFQFDTTVPIGNQKIVDHVNRFHSHLRHGEIVADDYAQSKFEEATKKGLVDNAQSMSNFLDYRTIKVINGSVLLDTEIEQHATTPFMKRAPFAQDHDAKIFNEASKYIRDELDVDSARLMGDYVTRGRHQAPITFWDKSIKNCFETAVSSVSSKAPTAANEKDLANPEKKIGLSDYFKTCMEGDFTNRYRMLSERFLQTDPQSAQGKTLEMYVGAVKNQISQEEIDRADNPLTEASRKNSGGLTMN